MPFELISMGNKELISSTPPDRYYWLSAKGAKPEVKAKEAHRILVHVIIPL